MKIGTTEKILAAISTVALFLFFGVTMPCHILFQETFMMFPFTSKFFLETVSVPGGMSDYISGFLVQFFINPWLGAAIISIVITAVQYLTLKSSRCRKGWFLSLTFLPSIILTAFHCDEMSMLSADISIIASLSIALALMSIKNRTILLASSSVMIPIMYFAFGTLSLLFILPVIFRVRRFALWGIPLAVLCPLTSWYLMHLPLEGLIGGLHFYRTFDFPILPWTAGASALIFASAGPKLSQKTLHRHSHPVGIIAVTLLTCAAGWILISNSFRKHNCAQRELSYKYAFLLLDNKWDTILSEYEEDGHPSTLFPIISHNMALANNGRLADEMFRYPQRGIQSLIPKYKLDYIMPLVLSGIHLKIGLINEAQRYAFESLQSIPFFQKSARCYRILATTNIINGEYSVAEKYLGVLSHTLFYRREALRDLADMNWNPAIKECKEQRLDKKNLIYSEDSIPLYLSGLWEKSEKNTLALHYLLCYIMLQGDINSFREHFDKYFPKLESIPEHYAEALLVWWTARHKDSAELPWDIPEDKCSKCLEFRKKVMSKKTKGELRKQYGDTYWYYLLFNNQK